MGRVKFQIDCGATPRHGVAANRLTINMRGRCSMARFTNLMGTYDP